MCQRRCTSPNHHREVSKESLRGCKYFAPPNPWSSLTNLWYIGHCSSLFSPLSTIGRSGLKTKHLMTPEVVQSKKGWKSDVARNLKSSCLLCKWYWQKLYNVFRKFRNPTLLIAGVKTCSYSWGATCFFRLFIFKKIFFMYTNLEHILWKTDNQCKLYGLPLLSIPHIQWSTITLP